MVSQRWADHSPRDIAKRARAAMQLDGADPEVLCRAGDPIAQSGGDMAGGIAIVNKSIELYRNSAIALQAVGSLYAYAGDKENAIACLERSERGWILATLRWTSISDMRSHILLRANMKQRSSGLASCCGRCRTTPVRCVTLRRASGCLVARRKADRSCNDCSNWPRTPRSPASAGTSSLN